MLWDTMVFTELDQMRRDFEAQTEMNGIDGSYRNSFPLFNIYENKDEFILTAMLPGIGKDQIDIRYDEGSVTFTGARPLPVSEGKVWIPETPCNPTWTSSRAGTI